MNMRALSLLSVCGATALLAMTSLPSADAYSKFAKMIPNGNGVKGVTAVGHTDPESGGDTNAFGKAFGSAGKAWTEALCKADSDGDGQTNGEELGDPCCVWKSGGTPAVPSGATDPGSASSKLDDATLAKTRALCKAAETPAATPATTPAATTAAPAAGPGTVKPNEGSTNETPSLTPGTTKPAPADSPAAASTTPAATSTPATTPATPAAVSSGSDDYEWVALEDMNKTKSPGASSSTTSNTAKNSTTPSTANTSSAAMTHTAVLSSSGLAAVIMTVVSALALAL